jgi:hypothetical protein
MERFIINTVVMNRYQLIEEIEIDANMNFQIWGVTDTQNNQKLIGKFWKDGRVEWFNDNRPISSQVQPQQPNNPVFSNSKPKRVLRFVTVFLLIGLSVFGYTKRKELSNYFDKIFEGKSSDLVAPTTHFSTPNIQVNNITPNQAAEKLEDLKNINPDQHQKLFINARLAFIQLRKTATDPDLIEELYKNYTEKGEETLIIHEQNGDRISLDYAIAWFRLAYALNPSTDLEAKINQMKGVVAQRKQQRVMKGNSPNNTVTQNQPLFMPDPEINEENENE